MSRNENNKLYQITPFSENAILIFSLIVFALISVATILLEPSLVARFYPLLPDKGPAWYFWQLPSATTLTRITYWTGYAVHQLVLWALLFQVRRNPQPKTGGISRLNLWVLGINLLFVILHLVQTQLWYDGLARDVPIWTSQGSVIVMLVLILYMELPRRGLFWGKSFQPPRRLNDFIRSWHGIYISWAIVYTFWFHPMDGNWGLMSGFIYMFLLFIQLSLFDTRLHFNRGWIVLLESFVAIHGTLITVYKDNPVWPMFLFGFAVMFFLTQMHTWKMPVWLKWTLLGAFLVSVILVYALVRGFNHIYEVTFIPVALYGGVLVLIGIGKILDRLPDRVKR